MRLPSSIAGLLVIAFTPRADAGVVDYLGSYFFNRKYAARHAPYAVTRALREWITGEPVIVTIKNSTILMPVFATRDGKRIFERRFPLEHRLPLERRVLEPLAYYYFLPLVEADCALNGHPALPKYEWKFFGRNLE
jgi:hypothetical protein